MYVGSSFPNIFRRFYHVVYTAATDSSPIVRPPLHLPRNVKFPTHCPSTSHTTLDSFSHSVHTNIGSDNLR